MSINNEKKMKEHNKEHQNATVGNSETKEEIPYDAAAPLNPKELATFPKQEEIEDPNPEEDHEAHLASKVKSPVRNGRNITNTGTMPDENGFL
ncbi:hypothetical protein [Flavobacterium litorale]|uniref:Uncharacterized protein n=1 Tax=Flavobacterium litorale TaxID=2856519 RepID=A0ABX8V6L4_9FLAO|nr:hypothetical protein [Flavobacterium litorale]QYJ68479.1 hypothetical protein K1I41_00935 [Flavobacterium litorale]